MQISFKKRDMKKEQRGLTLIELMTVTAVIGVLVSIAMPAYQDYTVRAQVSEGLALSAGAKAAMIDYFIENGAWPENNNKAGAANHMDIKGSYVKYVMVKKNAIEIMYSNDAHKAIRNKKITLTASERYGIVTWTCASAGVIQARYLPSACR
jgi:type IV pilus assembly protein PilA